MEIIPKAYLVGVFRIRQKLRINTFRCEMCAEINKDCRIYKLAHIIVCYLDAILCYLIFNPEKCYIKTKYFIDKIIHLKHTKS